MLRGAGPSNAAQAEGTGVEELSQGVLFPVLGASKAGSGLPDTISGIRLCAKTYQALHSVTPACRTRRAMYGHYDTRN